MLQNVQHQLLQSPTRLGLPTPSSPSLQNTAPPPKFSSQVSQPNQQANILTTTTTSSTLLPLLPPLSRAQSLLIQMASLASRLFEVSPNRSHWLSAFRGSFPSFLLQHQFHKIPAHRPQKKSSQCLLLFRHNCLKQLLNYKKYLIFKMRSKKSPVKLGQMILQFLPLPTNSKELSVFLTILLVIDYRSPKRAKLENDTKESSVTSVATQLKLSDILSYAHRISYTTFAPPEFGGGQAPLRGALPPAPQDEQLRASQLYVFADLDVGLPKTDEGKENILEPLIEPAAESNPLANLSSIQGLVPPNIVVPSGWKPGMPVELPTDLPLPPPGWKPGDPIALPPVDSRPPQKVEEAPARPVPPPGLSRMPEPIQVRHVQLDIDDDSSDYSSDEASSDSED